MIQIINTITIFRILLAPVIFIFLMLGSYAASTILFFLAGMTDFFDGYLARKYNAESELGEILDPIADKIIVVFILVGLSVSLDSYLIAFLSCLIISREIAVAALRDYSARNNLSHRTKVTFLAKTKTAFQLSTIATYLFAMTLNLNLLLIICDIFLIISTLITVYTGYQYAVNVYRK